MFEIDCCLFRQLGQVSPVPCVSHVLATFFGHGHVKPTEWQKNKPECTRPFKVSHPSVSADIPLAKTDHTVEPSAEIRQGHSTRGRRAVQLMTVGETTGKGKEMGPSLQSTTHPSSHRHLLHVRFQQY